MQNSSVANKSPVQGHNEDQKNKVVFDISTIKLHVKEGSNVSQEMVDFCQKLLKKGLINDYAIGCESSQGQGS